MNKIIKRGIIFFHSPFYYLVENWDDTDQMWICININLGLVRHFKEEEIIAGM